MRRCFAAPGLVVVALAGACDSHELDDAKAVVEAEDRETVMRRELVRLERELAAATGARKVELEREVAAQRERVRAAEIEARKQRIQRRQ